MIEHRIVDLPAFEVVGPKTWISGQDNEIFGRFWERCRQDGSLDVLRQITGEVRYGLSNRFQNLIR